MHYNDQVELAEHNLANVLDYIRNGLMKINLKIINYQKYKGQV